MGHLEWRVRLFGAGAILAMAGLYAGWEWLIWIAIVILLGGFLLRFLPPPSEEDEGFGAEDEPDPRPPSGRMDA